MEYVTYEFYTGVYGGALPEATFTKYANRAELIIDQMTDGRAQQFKQYMEKNLAYATCEFAEHLNTSEAVTNATAGGNVASESNDGFSQTYVTADVQAATKRARTKEIASVWLTSPFNLLYGGGPR